MEGRRDGERHREDVERGVDPESLGRTAVDAAADQGKEDRAPLHAEKWRVIKQHSNGALMALACLGIIARIIKPAGDRLPPSSQGSALDDQKL